MSDDRVITLPVRQLPPERPVLERVDSALQRLMTPENGHILLAFVNEVWGKEGRAIITRHYARMAATLPHDETAG